MFLFLSTCMRVMNSPIVPFVRVQIFTISPFLYPVQLDSGKRKMSNHIRLQTVTGRIVEQLEPAGTTDTNKYLHPVSGVFEPCFYSVKRGLAKV